MKKDYSAPQVVILFFHNEQVIVTSLVDGFDIDAMLLD